jgi:hypothetical protein
LLLYIASIPLLGWFGWHPPLFRRRIEWIHDARRFYWELPCDSMCRRWLDGTSHCRCGRIDKPRAGLVHKSVGLRWVYEPVLIWLSKHICCVTSRFLSHANPSGLLLQRRSLQRVICTLVFVRQFRK